MATSTLRKSPGVPRWRSRLLRLPERLQLWVPFLGAFAGPAVAPRPEVFRVPVMVLLARHFTHTL